MKKNEEVKPHVIDQMILQQTNEKATGVGGKALPDDFMATEMQDVAGFLKPKVLEFTGTEIWKAYTAFSQEIPALDYITPEGTVIVELFHVRSEKGVTKSRDNHKVYQYKVFNFGRLLSPVPEYLQNHYALLAPSITIWQETEEWHAWHARITNERPVPTFLVEPPKYGSSLLSSLQESYGILQNVAHDFYIGDVFTFALPVHGGIIKAFQNKTIIEEQMKALYNI